MIRQTWLGLFKIVLSLNAIQKHPAKGQARESETVSDYKPFDTTI